MNRQPWPQEHKRFVEENYPLGKLACLKKLNQRFKASYTLRALEKQAARLKVTSQSPDGYYSLAEVALYLGMHRNSLWKSIQRGTLKAQRFGRVWCVTEADFLRLEKLYQKAPWPSIRAADAARLLGYGPMTLNAAIKRGSIPAVKVGQAWHIPKHIVDAAQEYLRVTGYTRVIWADFQELKIG